jgi:hypothetical protein
MMKLAEKPVRGLLTTRELLAELGIETVDVEQYLGITKVEIIGMTIRKIPNDTIVLYSNDGTLGIATRLVSTCDSLKAPIMYDIKAAPKKLLKLPKESDD